ncbi:MAG: hypothetical protein CVU59_05415 [Deltaproteobacteria bacterium HGW-Deltaproteobacteria-17]|nr:MAG: hypothetical protein CVU59_05415 [Deltaproteobacteria bacterium HGW-Deltaproteobacteria-17]
MKKLLFPVMWILLLSACDDPAEKSVCPDGVATGSESCDGADLRGATCQTLGYYGGTLACSAECGWDLTGCEPSGRCGDQVLQGAFEQCDGADVGLATCENLGLGTGQILCTASCRLDDSGCSNPAICGDGLLQGSESCDGADLGGQTCAGLGFAGGSLACNTSCEFDTSACQAAAVCGDGFAGDGEACDGADLGGQTCLSLGYYGGELACTGACTLDQASCTAAGRCGDGSIQGAFGEACDGTDLGGQTCETRGFVGGTLACTASCTFNESGCGDSQADIVCGRWNADRADMNEGIWSGSVNTCSAGDIGAPGRANALKLVNLYRFLVDLPPVTTDPVLDAKAEKCALMMTANNTINHFPPTSWTCYSADGANAAGSSNLATTPGVQAVDLYMVDPGNPTTMGHRRWILSNSFGPTGLGSTNSYSCMWAFGSGNAGKSWTAYPGPGVFPAQAVNPSWSSIDQTGWTLQSDSINLGSAAVTITMDGSTNRPVTITHLGANYGSSYAISMIPQGWTTQAGHTYHVSVTGVTPAISYDVEVVDCSAF